MKHLRLFVRSPRTETGRIRAGCVKRAGIGVIVTVLCFGALAQYAVTWAKIAGGGGTSTNGQYVLSGTAGQPDAGGSMTNGQFSLIGGFWVVPEAVQAPGAPALSIAKAAPGLATISWAPATAGFVLQESLNPTGGWTNSASGATNPVTVPAVVPRKFYRLFKL